MSVYIKDQTIMDLCNERLELFKNTEKLYTLLREYYRLAILIANMKRIYMDGAIENTKELIRLQQQQINNEYTKNREEQIVNIINNLNSGDWSDSEKNTLLERTNKMRDIEQEVKELSAMIEECKLPQFQEGIQVFASFANLE